jgi:Flp pilus assembly protein TadB
VILLWALLSGMAVIGGLIGVIAGVVGTSAPRRASLRERWKTTRSGTEQRKDVRLRRRTLTAAALVVFVAVWLVSGNFVAGAMVGAAVVGVPWLIAPAQIAQERIGQLEALSEWTQRLAGLLRLGMGLEQAMITSRRGARRSWPGRSSTSPTGCAWDGGRKKPCALSPTNSTTSPPTRWRPR